MATKSPPASRSQSFRRTRRTSTLRLRRAADSSGCRLRRANQRREEQWLPTLLHQEKKSLVTRTAKLIRASQRPHPSGERRPPQNQSYLRAQISNRPSPLDRKLARSQGGWPVTLASTSLPWRLPDQIGR